MAAVTKYACIICKKLGALLNRKDQELIGITVIGILILFFSSWWNRYLSPASGGLLMGLRGFDMGMFPYRDYYAPAPPGQFLLNILISWFSGSKLIVFWGVGVLLRLSGAICIYVWLCRFVRPLTSAIVVISTIIFASVDIADIPYFYNHTAVTFAIFSAFSISFIFDSTLKRQLLFSLVGGVFLGSALLIKQTTGIIVAGCLVGSICFLFASRKLFKEMGLNIASLVAGIAIPIVGCLLWISSLGALPSFFDQVFGRGPSSKGGALVSLLRPVTLTLQLPYLSIIAAISLLLLVWGMLLYKNGKRKGFAAPIGQSGWLVVCGLIGAILLGRYNYQFSPYLRIFLPFAYLSMIGCLSICLWMLVKAVLVRYKNMNHNLCLLAALGFGCAYSLSVSWPAFEVMIFPGFTVLLALILERTGIENKLSRAAILSLLVCLVVLAVAQKHSRPYDWGLWREPPLVFSTLKPNIPELAGFMLSPQTERFYEKTIQTIHEHSTAQDRIFVYPNLPMLYALSHRRPATFGLAHWVDTCPDFIAENDAQHLLQKPPKVMVIHSVSPDFIKREEQNFRGGKPSGIRKIIEAIQILIPNYKLVQSLAVPGDPEPIRIWVLES